VLLGALAGLAGCAAAGPAPSIPLPLSDTLPGERRVTVLRHGESIASARGVLSTSVPGEGLTYEGSARAARAAIAMKNREFDALFSSPLARATETAAAFAATAALPMVPLTGLQEISAGDYEGMSAAQYGPEFAAFVDTWSRGQLDLRIPGGESGHEFMGRMDAAVAQAAAAGVNSLVISHGEAIRCWAGNRLAPSGALHLGYTGFIVLQPDASAWRIVEARPDGF